METWKEKIKKQKEEQEIKRNDFLNKQNELMNKINNKRLENGEKLLLENKRENPIRWYQNEPELLEVVNHYNHHLIYLNRLPCHAVSSLLRVKLQIVPFCESLP